MRYNWFSKQAFKNLYLGQKAELIEQNARWLIYWRHWKIYHASLIGENGAAFSCN